jgi:hypothetical protein
MAAGPGDSAIPLYAFEKATGRVENRADPRATRAELEMLWRRLDAKTEQLPALEQHDPESWLFLLRYVAEGPLCIHWYEHKRPELEAKQGRYNTMVMVVALALFLLAFLLPFQPLLLLVLGSKLGVESATSTTGLVDLAALLGVVGTGTTVALRLSARGVRYRRQAAVFHKASATLKEQLYRLESEWRGKPLVETLEDGTTRMTPAFDDAIRRAVGQAQAVVADERDQFFDTLILDVNAVTEDVTAATGDLGARVAFRSDRRHQDAQRQRDLASQADEAQLAYDTATAKIAVLEQTLATASDDQRPRIQVTLLEQKLAQQEADQRRKYLQTLRRSPTA